MDILTQLYVVRKVIAELHGEKAAAVAIKVLKETIRNIIQKELIYGVPKECILAAFVDTIKAIDQLHDIECESTKKT